MDLKVTFALLGLFLAGLVVFLLVNAPPEENGGRGELWPGFVATDVSEMDWDTGAGEIRVRRAEGRGDEFEVRAGDRWVPAEADPVLDILNELDHLPVRTRRPGDEVDAQLRLDAGLTVKKQWFRFVLRGETHEIRFGNPGLGRDTVYAALEGSDDVLLVGDGLRDTLVPLRVEDLRRRKVFRWVVSDVDRLEVEKEGSPRLKARRHEEEKYVWWAEFPYRDYLDPDGIEGDFLGALLGLRAKRFVNDAPDEADLAGYGLERPRYRVRLRKGRGENVTRTVDFGADVPDDPELCYFRIVEEPFVYAGPKKLVFLQFEKDPADLRDRNLTRLGWAALGRIRGRYRDVEFELRREEDEWAVTSPEGMTADGDAVQEWLEAMRKLSILRFVDGPDLRELGLAEPAGEVSFYRPRGPDETARGESVPPVAALEIGRETGEGVYARRPEQEGVAYLAPRELVRLLEGGAWRFRSKAVFSFRPGSQEATALRREGLGEELEGALENGRWSGGLTPERVEHLGRDLLAVTALRWVGPAQTRAEECGTEEEGAARLLVTYGEGPEAKVYGLRIGKPTEGGRFARAVREGVAGEGIFVLSQASLDLLAR